MIQINMRMRGADIKMTKDNLRVAYRVDMQRDFIDENGKLAVPDAKLIRLNIQLLTNFYKNNPIFVMGGKDRHFGTPDYKERETELQVNGGPFPMHCQDKTCGQQYIPEADISDGREIDISHSLDNHIPKRQIELAIDNLDEVYLSGWQPRGVYFEKQSYDIFTNPNLDHFLSIAKIYEMIVDGVATDYCVKAVVLGMQKRGIQCYVVSDAIKGVSPESTKSALEEMTRAGAKFVTTEQILKGGID